MHNGGENHHTVNDQPHHPNCCCLTCASAASVCMGCDKTHTKTQTDTDKKTKTAKKIYFKERGKKSFVNLPWAIQP